MAKKGKRVYVNDGNVEKALRKFKKRIAESGLLQEVQTRQSFVKPTTKRKIERSQAKRRWEKYLRDQQLPKKLY